MRLVRPPVDLAPLLDAPLTYPEVGATAGELPVGYAHVDRRHPLGYGVSAYDSAADLLLAWDMHRGAGLHVTATAPTAVDGAVVALTLGPRALSLLIPCRVVYTVAEPGHRGFAYGTLAGHPECGEELFVVSIDAAERVTCEIRSFSRQASTLARVGAPVARAMQRRTTNRYVRALLRAAGTD